MSSDKKNTLISFYDSYTPAVKAGVYNLETTLNLDKYINESKNIQEFEVRSAQFSLQTSEIHGVFPPHNSVSNYTEVLPSVVINTKTLPWEREAKGELPWLYLLALREDEIELVGENQQKLNKQSVERFFQDSSNLTPKLNTELFSDDVKNSICISFSIDVSKLKSLLPKNIEDYKYINHVREVDISNQADLSYEEPGWFSVVVGNRLLSSRDDYTKYYIHLISLEGVLEKLEDAKDSDTISLISLNRYSCTSQKRDGKSFEELVKDIVYKGKKDSSNFLLRKDMNYNRKDVDTKVLDKLKEGYTALNFNFLTKEESFSWYRGPFVPLKLDRINSQKNFYSSSNAALIYDEENGIFDNSYASAWTLGRLLALSNGSFSQKLFNTKKVIHNGIGRLVDAIQENPELLNNPEKLKKVIFKNSTQKLLTLIKTGIEVQTENQIEEKNSKKELNTQEVLESLFQSDELFEYLKESEFIRSQSEIIEWFARKKLLYDVPLNYLLPNPDYLPSESIRFFYMDDNWIDSLISGAFSIGVSIKKDIEVLKKLKEYIKPEIIKKAQEIRDELLGKALGEYRKEGVCGLLLNSSIVSGWKGLEVEGFIDKTSVNIVRMDHLSENILLCIFDDIPKEIRITEPQQSLCFGFIRDTKDDKEYKKVQLRTVRGNNLGKAIDGEFYKLADEIIDENSVVNMDLLQKKLAKDLGKEYLTSSEFALQMIKAPQRVVFESENI